MNHHRRFYNYGISRARNIVENTYGFTESRFIMLHTSIGIGVGRIIYVVLAI
jgi:hypothetical protein